MNRLAPAGKFVSRICTRLQRVWFHVCGMRDPALFFMAWSAHFIRAICELFTCEGFLTFVRMLHVAAQKQHEFNHT